MEPNRPDPNPGAAVTRGQRRGRDAVVNRRISIVALLICGVLVLGAAPAGAGLSDKEEEFCTAYSELGTNTEPSAGDSSAFESEQAEASAKEFRDLAKEAPTKKIKKAVKRMAKYFQLVSDFDSESDYRDYVASRSFSKYTAATLRVSTYVLQTCAGAFIPDDLDVPDGVELPDGFELPGGFELPEG